MFNYIKAIRQEAQAVVEGVGSALKQFDDLFGRVRILLQMSSDMQS